MFETSASRSLVLSMLGHWGTGYFVLWEQSLGFYELLASKCAPAVFVGNNTPLEFWEHAISECYHISLTRLCLEGFLFNVINALVTLCARAGSPSCASRVPPASLVNGSLQPLVPPASVLRFPQPQFWNEKFWNESSETKVPKRKFWNESSETKVTKHNICNKNKKTKTTNRK